MKYVFALLHSYDNEELEPEEKILGFFLSEDEANGAIGKYRNLPGFSSYPDGFIVDKVELGKLSWSEGFERVSAKDELKR